MPVHEKFQPAKIGRADDVLERFSIATAFEEFPQFFQLGFGENALETQIQFHARHLKEMGEQKLDLQSWRFDSFFREKIRATLNDFEDGHGARLGFVCTVQKGKIED